MVVKWQNAYKNKYSGLTITRGDPLSIFELKLIQ